MQIAFILGDTVKQRVGSVAHLRADHPDELDGLIEEMIDMPKAVIFDCRVERAENCFPMIPSGKAHNEMMLGDEAADLGGAIDDAGKALV